MMKKIIYALWIFLPLALCAQDFKMGYSAPAVSASPAYRNVALEVEGIDMTNPNTPVAKGILIPSMTTNQRNGISSASPSGLLVYDTDLEAFFFLRSNNVGGKDWAKIDAESGRSVLTDTSLIFQGSNNVDISSGPATLRIQKGTFTFIQIPQGAGPGVRQPGIIITDGSDPNTTTPSALVNFNSNNKGILLPRTSDPLTIDRPPFGLMVIRQNSNSLDGVYINMGDPASPSWKRIAVDP